jgi:hypothetical protein
MQIEAATRGPESPMQSCREGEVRQYDVDILFVRYFLASAESRT